jgi:hypothetical protein
LQIVTELLGQGWQRFGEGLHHQPGDQGKRTDLHGQCGKIRIGHKPTPFSKDRARQRGTLTVFLSDK